MISNLFYKNVTKLQSVYSNQSRWGGYPYCRFQLELWTYCVWDGSSLDSAIEITTSKYCWGDAPCFGLVFVAIIGLAFVHWEIIIYFLLQSCYYRRRLEGTTTQGLFNQPRRDWSFGELFWSKPTRHNYTSSCKHFLQFMRDLWCYFWSTPTWDCNKRNAARIQYSSRSFWLWGELCENSQFIFYDVNNCLSLNFQVCLHTHWAIWCLVQKQNENVIRLVIDSGITPKLVSILNHPEEKFRNISNPTLFLILSRIEDRVPAVLGYEGLKQCLAIVNHSARGTSRVLIILNII